METDSQQPKKQLPERLKATQWQKGQSGNPGGRPCGTGKKAKALAKAAEEARLLKVSSGSRALLNLNAPAITKEVIDIALSPPIEKIEEKDGKKVIKITHSQAKVKCLLACFDRIHPVLKVKELEEGPEGKRPSEMSDAEIILMMERMVNLAQGHGELDG